MIVKTKVVLPIDEEGYEQSKDPACLTVQFLRWGEDDEENHEAEILELVQVAWAVDEEYDQDEDLNVLEDEEEKSPSDWRGSAKDFLSKKNLENVFLLVVKQELETTDWHKHQSRDQEIERKL